MRKLIPTTAWLAILLFACHHPKKATLSAAISPYAYTTQKNVVATNGAVVSAHALASRTGLYILQKGGNAFDAAIATQLALAVVYPNAGNLGGGGFLVARRSNGDLLSLDYREKAPAAAHRDLYLDADGKARTDKSQYGHLSSGVPGTVAGLFETLPYARLPMADLVRPAIELAKNGFVISEREAAALNRLRGDLERYNTVPPVFLKDSPWKAGDTLVQKDLARTLERISEKGRDGFYKGETARLIAEEMRRGGGIITEADLAAYEARKRPPHQFSYKQYTIVSMPMPSSGGVLLHQMMKMIEERDIASMGFHSPASVQLMTEVQRRAFADRGEYMGDADYFNVPVQMLTNPVYLQHKMKDYVPGKATPSHSVKPGYMVIPESEETTHLSVIDKEGNAVAVTTTLNNSYGSRTVVGGAGFFLNDEMDDFSIKPGVPNMYGAIGAEANAIAPGKRMLSSMTPTLVLKDGGIFLVVGTPGGTTIPTQVFQTLVNILEFGLSAEDAVNKPKFHHQWIPDTLEVEKNFPQATREALRQMGYILQQRGAIGRTELIRVRPDGRFEAVADSRGEDAAEGF